MVPAVCADVPPTLLAYLPGIRVVLQCWGQSGCSLHRQEPRHQAAHKRTEVRLGSHAFYDVIGLTLLNIFVLKAAEW